MRVTNERAAELARMHEAATKDWEVRIADGTYAIARRNGWVNAAEACVAVAARNALPDLLADRAEMLAEIERLRQIVGFDIRPAREAAIAAREQEEGR